MSPAGKKDSIVRHRENNPFRSPPNRHLCYTHSPPPHMLMTLKSPSRGKEVVDVETKGVPMEGIRFSILPARKVLER